MYLDSRPEFHRAHIRASSAGLAAYSTGGQRSSRAGSLAGANGLVALPALVRGGPDKVKRGEYADAVILGELEVAEKW